MRGASMSSGDSDQPSGLEHPLHVERATIAKFCSIFRRACTLGGVEPTLSDQPGGVEHPRRIGLGRILHPRPRRAVRVMQKAGTAIIHFSGVEVARACGLRDHHDGVRGLHARRGRSESAARAGCACERRHRQRCAVAPLDGGLDMAACRMSQITYESVGRVCRRRRQSPRAMPMPEPHVQSTSQS